MPPSVETGSLLWHSRSRSPATTGRPVRRRFARRSRNCSTGMAPRAREAVFLAEYQRYARARFPRRPSAVVPRPLRPRSASVGIALTVPGNLLLRLRPCQQLGFGSYATPHLPSSIPSWRASPVAANARIDWQRPPFRAVDEDIRFVGLLVAAADGNLLFVARYRRRKAAHHVESSISATYRRKRLGG